MSKQRISASLSQEAYDALHKKRLTVKNGIQHIRSLSNTIETLALQNTDNEALL